MKLEQAYQPHVDFDLLNATLACPGCHGIVKNELSKLTCPHCNYFGGIKNGVIFAGETPVVGSFDQKFITMRDGNATSGVQTFCYTLQSKLIETYLKPGQVVLDVGCGPSLPYRKDPHCFLIGIDPSFPSIQANTALDMKICGSAEELPLKSNSLDMVICLYSIHHMVGESVRENRQRVERALKEFQRVLKPGGNLLIFEVNPWAPVWIGEKIAWNGARRILGKKLDMHFWSVSALQEMGNRLFGKLEFRLIPFDSSPWITFPPVFTMPWLKIPRLMYPFDVNCFLWKNDPKVA